jgi:hypothetical protein
MALGVVGETIAERGMPPDVGEGNGRPFWVVAIGEGVMSLFDVDGLGDGDNPFM